MSANRERVSFDEDEKGLKLMRIVQPCEYIKKTFKCTL